MIASDVVIALRWIKIGQLVRIRFFRGCASLAAISKNSV